MFWSFVADLQYIEKVRSQMLGRIVSRTDRSLHHPFLYILRTLQETGLMRHSGGAIGDGLSVLWCVLCFRAVELLANIVFMIQGSVR